MTKNRKKSLSRQKSQPKVTSARLYPRLEDIPQESISKESTSNKPVRKSEDILPDSSFRRRYISEGSAHISDPDDEDKPYVSPKDKSDKHNSAPDTPTKSLKGAKDRFFQFNWTSRLMIITVVFVTLIPCYLLAYHEPEPIHEPSIISMDKYPDRKKLFKQLYYSKLSIGQRGNNVLWSAIEQQRLDPPDEPLIFLLFSASISAFELNFARDLGRVARQQSVTEVRSDEIQSRHSFLNRLESSFATGHSVVVNRLDQIEPADALALYGIAEEKGMNVAKNKTIVLLFESSLIDDQWTERDHYQILKVRQ